MPKKAPEVIVPEAVARPTLQWEVGAHSLEDIQQKYPLPRVVQCAYTLNDDMSTEQSNFDFLQPMLLYQKRVCNKVSATSLTIDPQTGHTVEVGSPLLIPDDYKGWFAVQFTSFEKPIPHYRKVANLASSDCETFLIGGEHEVNAVQINKQGAPPQQRILYPGDVLRMGHLYVTTSKVKKSMFSKSVTREERFLLCTDQTDRGVLLPMDAAGVFYILKHKTTQKQAIMQIKDIIDKQQLPCKVKLVYGRVPVTPCIFTGILNLNEFHLETSAIVSSVFNLRNILLEIPTSIPLMFRVAKPESSLLNSSGYKDAMSLCQDNAERYMRNIKVDQGLPTEENRNQSTPPARHDKQTNDTTADFKPNAAANMDFKRRENTDTSVSPKEVKSLPQVLPKPLNLTGSLPDAEAAEIVTPKAPPRPPLKLTMQHTFSPPRHVGVNLDASVGFSSAPRLVIQSSPEGKPPAPPPASNKPKQESYESVWIEPKPSIPPPTPPKCVLSGYVQPKPPQKDKTRETIRISTTNDYLTVPMYLKYDNSDPEEVIKLADKINFWQRMSKSDLDGSNASPLNPWNDEIEADRAGSFTFSETEGPPKSDERRKQHVMVYENIEPLRQLKPGTGGSVAEGLSFPSSHSQHLDDGVNDTDYEMPDRPKPRTDDDRSSNVLKRNQIAGAAPPVPPPKPTKKGDIASHTQEIHQLPTEEDVIYESPDEQKHVTGSRSSNLRLNQRRDMYEPVDKLWQEKKEMSCPPSHLVSSSKDVLYESPDDLHHLEQMRCPSPLHVAEEYVTYELPDNMRQGMCDSPHADSGIGINDDGTDGGSTIVAMSAAEVNEKLRQAGGIKPKTLTLLIENNIDGRQLFDMGEDGLQLKFPSISNIEKRMINLFLHGSKHGVFKL